MRFCKIIFPLSSICLGQWRLYGAYDARPGSLSYGSWQLDKIPPSPAPGDGICIKPALTPRTSTTFLWFQPPPPDQDDHIFMSSHRALLDGQGVARLHQIGSWDHYQRDPTSKPAFISRLDQGWNLFRYICPLLPTLLWWLHDAKGRWLPKMMARRKWFSSFVTISESWPHCDWCQNIMGMEIDILPPFTLLWAGTADSHVNPNFCLVRFLCLFHCWWWFSLQNYGI